MSQQIGRLAMRHEGKWWNAYYALPGTMQDALLLGSIHMQLVQTQARRDAFMAIMKDAVSDIIKDKTGVRPTWPDGPKPAPAHEKAGHG